jgi:hypothetical protein
MLFRHEAEYIKFTKILLFIVSRQNLNLTPSQDNSSVGAITVSPTAPNIMTKCRYLMHLCCTKCHLFIVMLCVVMLNDVMLNDVILNDVMLNDITLNDITLNDVMLNDVMLNDVMLSNIMRSVILQSVVMLLIVIMYYSYRVFLSRIIFAGKAGSLPIEWILHSGKLQDESL